MIFGQGATRCHPYVLKEMEAAANPDEAAGRKAFDELLFKHMGHAIKNKLGALSAALTSSKFVSTGRNGVLNSYYQDLTRMSRALAFSTDTAMLTLGGDLKRKELISARLGDGLSYLYLASAALKKFVDEGELKEDLPFVEFSLQHCLYQAAHSLEAVYRNFPNKVAGMGLKAVVFPLGNRFKQPTDKLTLKIAKLMMIPGAQRDRLTNLCYVGEKEEDAVGIMERAFIAMYGVKDIEKKITDAIKAGKISKKAALADKLDTALSMKILTQSEVEQVKAADKLRYKAIQVDHFSHDFSETLTDGPITTPTQIGDAA
jgi:hypothetical protein